MDQPPPIPSSGQNPYSGHLPPPIPGQHIPTQTVGRSPNIVGAGGYGPHDGGGAYRTPWWLWGIVAGLLCVLIYLQRPEAPDPNQMQKEAAGLEEKIKAPKGSEYILIGKLTFAVHDMFKGQAALPGEDPVSMLVQMSDGFAGWNGTNTFAPPSSTNPPKKNKEPEAAADRLRAAILAGEFLPPKEMVWRIEDVEKDLDPKSPLVEDVKIVRRVYGLGEPAPKSDAKPEADGKDAALDSKGEDAPAATVKGGATKDELAASHAAAAELTDDQKKGFRDRHGWFADLTLSRGDDASKIRESATTQGTTVLMLLIFVGGVVAMAGFIGLVLLVIALFLIFTGKWQWRLARPQPATEWPVGAAENASGQYATYTVATRPASVWLETVAVFFAMFLGVKGAIEVMHRAGAGKETMLVATLGLQWLVALAIFWPIVRGVSWERWRADIGWHKGRGVFREIGAGILGYLAGLPVYFFMAVVVVVFTLIWSAISGSEPHPPGNKITDLVEGGGIWELLLLYLLATVWAPIVEESIFRGCLFRHLRRRVPLIVAALGSAFVFAVLHGYIVQGLLMVGTLGFWFALMREWRGSIIASATAHAIHNGVVMAVIITVMSLAG